MEENKKIKTKIEKKKILKISLYTICLLLLLVAGSFAVYTANKPGSALNKLLIAAPDFKFTFTESNTVTLTNPFNNKKQDFNFQVKASSTEAYYIFDINYNIYLKIGSNNSITNDKVYIQLYDKENNELTSAIKISELPLVTGKTDEYVLKTENISITNETKTNNYILKYWYLNDINIDYTETNDSQTGTYTETGTFNMTVNVSMTDYEYLKKLDTSNANEPALLSNMIPVYYDETCNNNTGCWEKADSTNTNETYKWYNYNAKMWANAVTVDSTNRQTYIDAKAGTEIPMTEINSMWVWIPRYTYTYFNDGTNTPKEIQIQFEKGTGSSGTITCTDNVSGSGTTSQTCTDKNTTTLVAGTSTYTHPAFDFGGTQIEGFWMGKFENSANGTLLTSESTAEHTLYIKPNITSLVYKAVSYQFKDARQMEKYNNIYGFEQANSTTFTLTGELTGDTNNIDTHMLKNIEWGAVAYLSHSKYGTNKEIATNSQWDCTTGCGPQSADSTYDGATCNAYNTTLGQTASTTGNVYGVYDMSGGTWEYVMGNMVDSSGNFYPSNAGQWSSTTKPLAKYYDSYTYDASSNTTYTRGRLGDATLEMAPTGTEDNWYSDYAYFVYSTGSWFSRGGDYTSWANAGTFSFNYNTGEADSFIGSRSALVFLN